ncbi:MAG: sigma-70 family RNA polymerase sigma factor [Clostridiales Family XIII bacterium]|jgi:RNA polymerase sigma-70 factor (ECF subfamily)|nr:sigma-70 family RNA polymerase sigma factor [Clostridiales Family XIII bacterium]
MGIANESGIGERALIERAKRGDEGSFEALVMSCRKKAWNIALQYMRDENDAMDALQEAFIRIFRGLGKFKGDCRFDTWVYRITVNICKDMLKKNEKFRLHDSLYLEGDDGEYLRDIPWAGPRPDEALERKELADELLECMRLLPQDHREVIILRDIQGFSYEEISELLAASLGTVKSRINRARANLRRIWLEQKCGGGV